MVKAQSDAYLSAFIQKKRKKKVPYFVASGKAKLPHQATVSWLGNAVKGKNYYQKR